MNWSDYFNYDGFRLLWAIKPAKNIRKGAVAGCTKLNGYISIGIKGKEVLAHRIIYEMHHGPIPEGMEVDRINKVKDDNRLINLRVVSHAENNRNKSIRSNNTSGVTGVRMDKEKRKWHSAIVMNGTRMHLGYFDNFIEACEARIIAEVSIGYIPRQKAAQS